MISFIDSSSRKQYFLSLEIFPKIAFACSLALLLSCQPGSEASRDITDDTAAGTDAAVRYKPGSNGGNFVVFDSLSQFNSLKHHAEALAWRNDESMGAQDPNICDHYQGVTRYPGEGAPVFYVTQSDTTKSLSSSCLFDNGNSSGGFLHVIRFGTRDQDGERLRSNVQSIGQDTEEVTPAATDTWETSLRFDGNLPVPGGLDAYKHPGAPAIIDDVLILPMDQPLDSGSDIGVLVFFDLADKLAPTAVQAIPLGHSIDNLAVTRLGDGSYLLWTNGDGGEAINIYLIAAETDLAGGGVDIGSPISWDPASGLAAGSSWPTGAGAHQSSTFFRQADGSLYLLGMRHPGGLPSLGSDFADLYLVTGEDTGNLQLAAPVTREFNCVYDGGGGPVDMRLCNFTAGSGAYVSPSGELILYSVPHDDEDGFATDIVRMGEFRHRDVFYPENPLLVGSAEIASDGYTVNEGSAVPISGVGIPSADLPWVELYDDDTFLDRSIVVDYQDRALLELNDFNNLDGFNDKTSSVRWRSPSGLDIVLYDDDNFEDRRITLVGTGATESIANLDTQPVVVGKVFQSSPDKASGEALEFNDKTSSLMWSGVFVPDLAPDVFWDLDADNIFGETGTGATNGDESLADTLFDAGELDGPGEFEVSLRRVDGGVVDTATVTVLNVPPSYLSVPSNLSAECAMRFEINDITFADPGVQDTHTAMIDWGDGSPIEDLGSVQRAGYSASHTYDETGQVTVSHVVIDKDMDSDTAQTLVDIVDTMPPDLEASADVTELWPPNHKLKTVRLDILTTDLCGNVETQIELSCSDYSGCDNSDMNVLDGSTVELRSERAGNGDGRVYDVKVTATDEAQNVSEVTIQVIVPHDQRKN